MSAVHCPEAAPRRRRASDSCPSDPCPSEARNGAPLGPPSWPRLSRREADALNEAARWIPRSGAAEALSAALGFAVRPALRAVGPDAGPLGSAVPCVSLERSDGRRARVVVDPRLARQIVAHRLGLPPTAETSPLSPGEHGLLLHALIAGLDRLEALTTPATEPGGGGLAAEPGGGGLAAEGFRLAEIPGSSTAREDGTSASWLRLDFELTTDQGPRRAQVLLDGAPPIHPRPPRRRTAGLAGWRTRIPPRLRIPIRVEATRCALSLAELAGIAPGDWIPLGEAWSSTPEGDLRGPARLRVGAGRRGALPGALEPGRFRVQGAAEGSAREAKMEEHALENDVHPDDPERLDPASMGEDAVTVVGPLLGDVQVDVRIELAGGTVSAEELLDLAVGGVLDLKIAPAEPVLLRAGGRPLARGHLLEIEGQLGVRILELEPGTEEGR